MPQQQYTVLLELADSQDPAVVMTLPLRVEATNPLMALATAIFQHPVVGHLLIQEHAVTITIRRVEDSA